MNSISDIKDELQIINNMELMDYGENLRSLDVFIDKYSADERSGVVNLVTQAEKRKKALRDELFRVETMLEYERKAYVDHKYICGVDEVGRGPLAGPIVTAAVILPQNMIIPYVNDSKKLTEKMREKLYDIITAVAVSWSIGIKSHKEIDDIGISVADSSAMRDAVLGLDKKADMVLVDAFRIPDIEVDQIPIIKGDTKSISIAAASIVAKVTRDRMMNEYALEYPGYGFERNKGYGSAAHIEAIKTIGPCEIHRRSFIGNFV